MTRALLDQLVDSAPDQQAVEEKLLELVRVRFNAPGDPVRWGRALLALGKEVARIQATADIVARASMRLEIVGPKPVQFAREVPLVQAHEAMQDLLEREPVLATSAAQVQAAYSPESHAFALAKSLDVTLTAKVQEVLYGALQSGKSVDDATDLVAAMGDWTRGYACFLPGTLVEGAFVAGSEARYDGPAIEVKTDDGRRLRVTINHPVLTTLGWKHAGDLEEGSNLACYGAPVESLDALWSRVCPVDTVPQWRAIDDQETPALVEDVFETLAAKSPSGFHRECPVHPLDFHGDAAFFQGQVHIVGANGRLGLRRNSQQCEMPEQIRLMERRRASTRSTRNALGLATTLLDSACASATGLMHPPYPGLGCLGRRERPTRAIRIGLASHLDPALFETTTERLECGVELYRKLVAALPGKVSFHRVVEVKRFRWTGHIYDLQTLTGMIVARGIVTSNSTVVRTNAATSYAAGRFREAEAMDAEGILSGLRYVAVLDSNVRPNHRAAHGVVAAVDDPIWNKISPPMGFA